MERIDIAFCFDEKIARQVQVAVASLLDASRDSHVHYHIHCVCTARAAYVETDLQRIIAAGDEASALTMHRVENQYRDAYKVRGISAGAYLRLMLHRILPELDRIIYVDVDVLFCRDLRSLWETSLDGCVLGAVRAAVNLREKWDWNSRRPYWRNLEGRRGLYINSGVLLMDLRQIRASGLEEQWNIWAKEELYYQDQDILNLTCMGRIRYLAPRYNMFAYMGETGYAEMAAEGIYTAEEVREAKTSPVIVHYAGEKPWRQYDIPCGSLWWDYVNGRPDLAGLFNEKKARRYHGPGIWTRIWRRLNRLAGREIC